MLSLFSLTAFAQIKITGTASDAETGEPLSFITIQIKGTTAGTTSDMDGNYSIEVPNRDAILVYSYIGYRLPRDKGSEIRLILMFVYRKMWRH